MVNDTSESRRAGLPLDGIRVLELGHTVMGPACGLILADMGAEVIKIEKAPDGDATRRLTGSGAGLFGFFNRNKSSLVVDLKQEKGKRLLLKLAGISDVLIENFAPGAMDRLGLGYDALSEINPGLVYCSLKGFLEGPYQNRPALDEVVEMMGGLAYMTGLPGRPLRVGASVVDIMGGMFGVIGALVALMEREKTGKGQMVKASLFESVAFLMGQHMAYHVMTGETVPPMSQRKITWGVYDIFTTSDQKQIFIGVTSDAHWRKLCQALKLQRLSRDGKLDSNEGRAANRDTVIPALSDVIRAMRADELESTLESINIPFAPVAGPEDLFTHPQLTQGGGLLETTLAGDRKTFLPRLPLRVASHDFGLRNDPPALNEGALELLQTLDLSEEEIRDLRQSGTLTV